MADGNRGRRNRRIRGIIDQKVDALKPGETLKTGRVLIELNRLDRRWCLDAHMIGNLIREYDQLRRIGDGT